MAIQQGAYIGGAPGQKSDSNKGMNLSTLDFTPVSLWFPQDTKNFLIGGKYLILRKGKHNVRIIEMVTDEEWSRLGLTYPGEPYTGVVRQLRDEIKTLQKELEEEAAAMAATTENGTESGTARAETEQLDPPSTDPAEAASPAQLTFPEDKSPRVIALEEKLSALKRMKVLRSR